MAQDYLTEVEFIYDDYNIDGFYLASIPRIGEKVDITTDILTGEFIVKDVVHRAFTSTKNENVHYVRIYLKK